MTKVIILGQPTKEKQGKKIEFVKFLNMNEQLIIAEAKPVKWANIELICRKYGIGLNTGERYDLMYAYDEDRDNGTLYLGHFNDGIV